MTLPVHDPVLIFAIVMVIVLVAPLLFGKLRIPGIVGLIVAGAAVGPSGAGLLERDSTIILLGTVGLLYLMFVAGIALDLNQFNKVKTRSLTFGLLSFLFPQLLGIAAATHLLNFSLPSAVLLGSIVGSHTLLAYPVASRLGLAKNVAVTTTMGGTIVTDLLALLLLAVVARYTEGAYGIGFWILFFGLIAAFLAATVFGLPRVGRWFMRVTGSDPNLSFIFLVTALFVTSYLAQVVGLAPIIGAFIAGIVLNRLVPEVGPLMSRVQFVGEVFFIPFFLISVGMLVDFAALAAGLEVWIYSLLFIAVVLIGKFLAAKASGRIFAYSSAEEWLVFGLTVPQAAATLAVTLVGFNLGLFDGTVVNAVIVMILATSLLGPWFVERHGRRVALKEEAEPQRTAEAPQRILIPLANPATAHILVDVALAIRRDGAHEPVYPLTVVRPGRAVNDDVAAGEKLVGEAVVHAVAADVPVIPMTRIDSNPARGIARAVAERRISHVIIGWGGPPPPRERIFGSVLDQLLSAVDQTIFVTSIARPVNTFARIMLAAPPFAEREAGFAGMLRDVKMMADRLGAELILLVTPNHRRHVEKLARAARPDVPLRVEVVQRVDDLLDDLSRMLKPDDLVIMSAAKKEQISWQPLLDRLPRTFRQRFPEQDFIVVYPGYSEHTAERPSVAALMSDVRESPQGYVIDVTNGDGEAAVREMLRVVLGHEVSVDEVQNLLLHDLQAHHQELGESILLLHAHTDRVPRQIRIAGTRREGITFDGLDHGVRAVLVLLNPPDMAPSAHLRALARIAEAAHAIEQLEYDEMRTRLEEMSLFDHRPDVYSGEPD